MRNLIKLFILLFICELIVGPPVRPAPPKEDGPYNDLHYKTYLDEVIRELEADKKFVEAIKFAQEHNRTEHIAQSLVFVNHKIRNKLDEIKRKEIERLNILETELERRKLESSGKHVNAADPEFVKLISANKTHLDHKNPHSFETVDLEKLIRQVEQDLKIVDKEEEEEYKQHEMKKEYLRKEKLKSIKDPKERENEAKKLEEAEKRHDTHEKVHHPGNQEQLKEVWEKTDKLDPAEFNPKAFFELHDINSDGKLDINEIEALMQTELSKVYEANNTDDDMQERYHEMVRMRHEMLRSIDKNNDNLISKDEFLQYSSTSNFKDDSSWKTEEESDKKPYTDQELNEFAESYNGRGDDDEDEFSDQEETLRHIPKPESQQHIPKDPSPESHPNEDHLKPAPNPDPIPAIKADNAAPIPPPPKL